MSAEGLRQAIQAVRFKSVLARGLGIKPQAVDQWKRVPGERVLDVERITGVSRHVLRPDIFGPPPSSSSSLPAVHSSVQ